MATSVTAAATIVPALVAAGYPLVAKGDRYTCQAGFGTLSVRRRWENRTVALIEVYGDCSTDQMVRELVRVVEALQAAGYPARRDSWEVSVDWGPGCRAGAAEGSVSLFHLALRAREAADVDALAAVERDVDAFFRSHQDIPAASSCRRMIDRVLEDALDRLCDEESGRRLS